MASYSPIRTPEQQLLLACLSVSPDPERLALLLTETSDWDELHRQGGRHGVLPLLYQALKTCPDSLLPATVMARLQGEFAALALRNLQMQKALRRLIALLTEHKIAVIPFKGPTLALEVYGDLALRSFNDLDLLVPPERAQEAVQLLLAQGYLIDFELPQDCWASLQKTDNQLALYPLQQNWSVEIHWQLFHPLYALPFDLSAHWDGLVGGGEGRLEREETLVMLCAHGTKHLWQQLKWFADIDRLLRNGPPMNWQKVHSLARDSLSTRALLLGLHLSRSVCGTPLSDVIVGSIDEDSVVRALTEDVLANLFPENPERRQLLREYNFHLKSWQNTGERLRQIQRWLFWPRRADLEVCWLGERWYWLYYVERPLRMVWKWLVKPLIRRFTTKTKVSHEVTKPQS